VASSSAEASRSHQGGDFARRGSEKGLEGLGLAFFIVFVVFVSLISYLVALGCRGYLLYSFDGGAEVFSVEIFGIDLFELAKGVFQG
jgi:hypothetical protein